MAILKVPVTKAKSTIDVDTEKLPDEVYQEALMQGLKFLANRGMDKAVGKVKELTPDELVVAQGKALEQAQKNVEALYAGTIRKTAAKSEKVSGVVNTEAMRIARNMVKDALKHAGEKVSYYPASEITTAAKALLASDPAILEMARANLAARDEAAKAAGETLKTIAKTAKVSDKLVAKAKADAEEKKSQLSAKQAGKPKAHVPKAKPGTQATAH